MTARLIWLKRRSYECIGLPTVINGVTHSRRTSIGSQPIWRLVNCESESDVSSSHSPAFSSLQTAQNQRNSIHQMNVRSRTVNLLIGNAAPQFNGPSEPCPKSIVLR